MPTPYLRIPQKHMQQPHLLTSRARESVREEERGCRQRRLAREMHKLSELRTALAERPEDEGLLVSGSCTPRNAVLSPSPGLKRLRLGPTLVAPGLLLPEPPSSTNDCILHCVYPRQYWRSRGRFFTALHVTKKCRKLHYEASWPAWLSSTQATISLP